MRDFVEFLRREADIIKARTAEDFLAKCHEHWGSNPKQWRGQDLIDVKAAGVARAEEEFARLGYACVPDSATQRGRWAVWFGPSERLAIEVSAEWYVKGLEAMRASLAKTEGLDIPDVVFEQFCRSLLDGDRERIEGDGSHEAVIRTLAEGSEYGPIEDYNIMSVLRPVLRSARRMYIAENGGRKPGREELRQYVRGHREQAMEGSGLVGDILFWYRDDDSDYGISIMIEFGC